MSTASIHLIHLLLTEYMLLAVEFQLHKAKEKDLLTSIDRPCTTSGRQDDADRYVPITTVAAGLHVFVSTAALCADDISSSSSTTGRFVTPASARQIFVSGCTGPYSNNTRSNSRYRSAKMVTEDQTFIRGWNLRRNMSFATA